MHSTAVERIVGNAVSKTGFSKSHEPSADTIDATVVSINLYYGFAMLVTLSSVVWIVVNAISKLEAQSKLVVSLTSGDMLDRANFGIATSYY